MNKQRILKEAQLIASKYSFWMVSGDISHLYGYVLKTKEKEYDLEIKFNTFFPQDPPEVIIHDNIKDILGDVFLDNLINWDENCEVINILDELKMKLLNYIGSEEKKSKGDINISHITNHSNDQQGEDYITPDLNLYPPQIDQNNYLEPESSRDPFFFTEKKQESTEEENIFLTPEFHDALSEEPDFSQEEVFIYSDSPSIDIQTELGLIQQEYAFDKKGNSNADIVVYITITLTKTFLININFSNYPKKPEINFPNSIKKIINNPNKSLSTLKNWNERHPFHIVDILHELEKKLYSIKEIERHLKKIAQEYQYKTLKDNLSIIEVKLLTYGFKEYFIELDISTYLNPPKITLSSELENLIRVPISKLNSIRNWEEGKSEPIDVIREIDWLVDKNSRINFEMDLLNENNEEVTYDPLTHSLNVSMKGNMKTKDLTFEFRIDLPADYPMSMPNISVVNTFELESQEDIKETLNNSFNDFFNEWTPYSYLIDLFSLISKKIFEVSAVSCVICHKIDCPTCHFKIASSDDETCFAECPHCERPYHRHCWEQTISSFGKCGFCLKIP